ncbi:MAG: hypothetical protein JXR51_02475 [Bacteroidales bacterium]|nr:hypothetical protein [Bacteroidales bacterium]MBN2756013.1 hypothetical protein [Bacteroidales bacterium]
MLSFINKHLRFFLTGSFSIVFAACYGVPVELENPKLISTKNSDDQAIAGLKVQLFENRNPIDEFYTDENGLVEFYPVQKDKYHYSIKIEDIDGADNGGEFETAKIDITDSNFFEITLKGK